MRASVRVCVCDYACIPTRLVHVQHTIDCELQGFCFVFCHFSFGAHCWEAVVMRVAPAMSLSPAEQRSIGVCLARIPGRVINRCPAKLVMRVIRHVYIDILVRHHHTLAIVVVGAIAWGQQLVRMTRGSHIGRAGQRSCVLHFEEL